MRAQHKQLAEGVWREYGELRNVLAEQDKTVTHLSQQVVRLDGTLRQEVNRLSQTMSVQGSVLQEQLAEIQVSAVGWEKARMALLLGDTDFGARSLKDACKNNSDNIAANAKAIGNLQKDMNAFFTKFRAMETDAEKRQTILYINVGMTSIMLIVLLIIAFQLFSMVT